MTKPIDKQLWGPHWVYRMSDEDGCLLYVGMTADLQQRLRAWKSVALHAANRHWFWDVCRITSDRFPDKALAAAEERRAIETEGPLHNVRMATRLTGTKHTPAAVTALPRRGPGRPPGLTDTDRAERMVRAYVHDDLTLEQIGRRHGVTRERARQLVNRHDPTLYRLAKRRRRGRTRLRAFVNDGKASTFAQCPICGEGFEGDNRRRYCSPVHQQVAVLMRYQTDDDHRGRQMRANARWVLRTKPDDDRQVRNAQRVLDGAQTDRGRWLVQGSLQYHWALRACALGWPLFDALHEDVQRQLREAVVS